jgi:hypothetical protein
MRLALIALLHCSTTLGPGSSSAAPATCAQAGTPFPPTVGEIGLVPFNFTGDALPPDLMSNGKYYADGHPETLISHGNVRARVCVAAAPAAGGAVSVRLPWRRRDYNATLRDFIVRHAASGREVSNKRTLDGHSRFTGAIAFEPIAGAGEYHLYWLPHNCTCMMGYCGPSVKTVYPLLRGAPTEASDRFWAQQADPLPAAVFLGMQPRRAFDNFTAMELVATPAELQHAGGEDSWLLIPGDRMAPLRLTNASNGDVPIGWLDAAAIGDKRHDPAAVMSGSAQPGEWYAFQLGVWARSTSVEVLAVSVSGAPELSANFSCMSLGGSDYSGERFEKQWYLPSGRLSALWMGVHVPLAAVSATLKGSLAVSLRVGGCATAQTISVPIALAVAGQPIVNSGDDEPSKMSRLRWLDSRIGISDRVPKPYTPIDTSAWPTNRTLRILGRSLSIGLSGMPQQIVATKKSLGSEIFTLPGGWSWESSGPVLCNQSQSSVSWVAKGTNPTGVQIQVQGTLSFEGYVDLSLSLSCASAVVVTDFELVATLRAPFLMGLGRAGRRLGAQAWPLAHIPPTKNPAPSGCDANNSLPLVYKPAVSSAPMMWAGDTDGGLRIKWKGPGSEWDNPAYRGEPSWYNSGHSTITVANASGSQSDLVHVHTSTGPLNVTQAVPTVFHIDLCITPFKPRAEQLNSHFQSRYFQIGYPDHHMYSAQEVAATGATIATIHQGVDSMINPYINWPFAPASVELQANFSSQFAALSNRNHTVKNRFKLYYTARELTNHVAELFALRALGGEVIQGQGVTAENAANGGSTAWLLEHLVEDYSPCWQQNLGSGEFDGAVCDIGISRWSNYYLEGLRQMTENAPHTAGIYFDGINFGRSTMMRIRRTLDEAVGPSAAIDLHGGNDFSSWGSGPALRYMHMLPFVDSLWFGESFRYNSPSDYWLLEISGLPFGLSADMLGGDCRSPANCLSTAGPNPFRGMVFGMTGRYDEPTYASRLWHLWDEIGIEKMTMIGWFDADPAVHVSYNRTLQQHQPPPPPPANWSGPYLGYFSGCAGPGPGSPPPPCAGADTLDAAERACDALPFAQCAGVTKGGQTYQLRQGPGLASVPGGAEQSWARNCSNSTTSCPVALATIDDPVQATAFVLKGQKVLIALANFGLADANITLQIDWAQLGLSADSVKTLRAPILGGFTPRDAFGRALPGTANLQEAAEFPVDGVIPVRGASGWLLMLEPAAHFLPRVADQDG